VAALVGPNGAGKTTLLHMAVGLLQPDAGAVRIFGQTPYDNTATLSDIGFVAQDTPLYKDFSPAELVTMGGKMNRRWDAGLARGRLAALGIPPDRKVGTLSGGQRAQVALALALAKRPRLLLLDEPVASLDPLARREFLRSLMEFTAEHGASVILSSHLVSDLERVCDYLVVLVASRVRLAGEVDELLATHARLIGPRCQPNERPDGVDVLEESYTDRQSTLVVRTTKPVADPAWSAAPLDLEDLVLAYMVQSTDQRALELIP
jgi:ABC-2 type transport system ATP-binding protein